MLDAKIHTNSRNQSVELFEFGVFGLSHVCQRASRDATVAREYT